MQKLIDLLKSRKFWAAVIGLLVIVLRNLWPTFPLSDAQIQDIAFLLVAFIVGTGLEDVGSFSIRASVKRASDVSASREAEAVRIAKR